jgi:transcriptional regulator with XRE-family HTH domain
VGERLSNDIQTTFGNALRKYRLRQQLSQEKLAELAHLDRTYISQLERGLKSPSFRALIALARALNVQAHVMVSEVENELDQHPTQRRGTQSDEDRAD